MLTPAHHRIKSGATITELLIAVAIAGLLLSLLAPAIQAARETSRRMHCAHHLRQLGLAMAAYETAFQVLPPSTVPVVSNRSRHDPVQTLSAHARLLPFLDQKPLFDQIDTSETGAGSIFEPVSSDHNPALLSRRVVSFECPSDSLPAGAVSYRLCTGSAPGWPSRSIRGLIRGRRDQEFVDGRSQTVLFSERLVGDRDPSAYTPWRDTAFVRAINILDPDEMSAICRRTVTPTNDHWSWGGGSWLFSGYGNTWYNHVHTPNSPFPDCVGNSQASRIFGFGQNGAHTARSFHRGGVNVVFADGSSRMMSGSIDINLWRALGTEAGDEIANDF